MIAFLDGFLQVGDTVGRRCTDVKDSSKGLVLVTDEEEQTIHRGGDRKLERTRGMRTLGRPFVDFFFPLDCKSGDPNCHVIAVASKRIIPVSLIVIEPVVG